MDALGHPDLLNLALACRRLGWDGGAARPVDRAALEQAERLLAALEARPWPQPRISADPDGDVSLDWTTPLGGMLSLSIDRNGTLYWASLWEGDADGGHAPGPALPPALCQALDRLWNVQQSTPG